MILTATSQTPPGASVGVVADGGRGVGAVFVGGAAIGLGVDSTGAGVVSIGASVGGNTFTSRRENCRD